MLTPRPKNADSTYYPLKLQDLQMALVCGDRQYRRVVALFRTAYEAELFGDWLAEIAKQFPEREQQEFERIDAKTGEGYDKRLDN